MSIILSSAELWFWGLDGMVGGPFRVELETRSVMPVGEVSVQSADVWLRVLEACWVASRNLPVAEVGCASSMYGA